MTDLDPRLARALANTLLDLLPDYQLGREDIARQAQINPDLVERLYTLEAPVDPAQVTSLATFLGIDIDRYAAAARVSLE